MKKLKKIAIRCMSLVGVTSIFAGICAQSFNGIKDGGVKVSAQNAVQKINGSIDTDIEKYFDDSVIYKLPEGVAETQEISVIVDMAVDSLMDKYNRGDIVGTASEYVNSRSGKTIADAISVKRKMLLQKLNKSGVNYQLGAEYDTVLSGFEITIQAKDFEKVGNLFSTDANLIVGETYLPAETQIIHNDVDVYETGIFNTSKSQYQGDGVVVAVLDSGLDYTHSAFSVDNFTTENEAFTLETVSQKVTETVAAEFTFGLTGEDVYLNKKIPFAYDYADKDTDVLPTNSDHGTHVSGIIAGKDDTITGVAPNAQLAFMKVFSDSATGAKTSWLLAALEDCVKLGVDVVNMSLGSGCGFAREVDEENVNEVYDSIRDAGISLVVSAGNAYNSAFGSEKNGNLGLTSNPDTATVGSPSTYAASMSVASVDGVKTPYIVFNGEVIYFNEASTSDAKPKDFVDDILDTVGENVQSHDFEYVTIPGIGRETDYPREPEFYAGKIVLVKRGTTTFEDKVRIALNIMGAAGIIIYNNVSGTISMSVGKDIGAVCSISQDEGEMLAEQGTGILHIDRSHVAGPFMSDFSSWGPTSDLQIKPEITAHGGEILSAIPGQAYDVQSGTSMAAPNQAGATALIRQYVKFSKTFGENLSPQEVTKLVNQLMMSTTDIVMNKNGLPYAVRKQGSGLVNINKAVTSAAYITTFEKDGTVMDKTKLELGDDKKKTGVYDTIKFAINNVSGSTVSYDISSILITEGISETYTGHSETTVTQEGYLLDEAVTKVTGVEGGQLDGNVVTVAANGTATVTVEIKLSEAEKKYMNDSFAYGMYVEGFIKLQAKSGTTVDMSVPMLAFYGDWTQSPIFDEEYYDTHADELNEGKDHEDKIMADSYATRVIGGLYSDYIATLGSYYFEQDPAATKIAASKDRIAISNQQRDQNSSINTLSYVWAGLLRNVKEVDISIVEDSTGKVVFERTNYNQHKSFGNGGSTIYYSSMEVEFGALENNLKNNTKYTVTVSSYIDYGTKEEQNASNVRNTFQFPLYIDFESPIVTDVVYRREVDKLTKKTKLYADLSVYDNHYAMGLQVGQIVKNEDPETKDQYTFNMNSFGKYVTPVYSSFNSTSTVTIDLTDYVAQLKNSAGIQYNPDGSYAIKEHNNSFIVSCYDYALNTATYEIRLPDEILSMNFTEDEIKLSPNETLDVDKVLSVYPDESWLQTLDFTTTDSEIVEVVNQTIFAKKSGTATITATGYTLDGQPVSDTVNVKVYSPSDEGYNGSLTVPEINKFTLTGYKVNKAYYGVSSEDREIGLTDGEYEFGGNYALSMFPSESVQLKYTLDSYFPNKTNVTYVAGDPAIATVTDDGVIVAQAEGTTIISVSVTFDGKPTIYSASVAITVKDPFETNAIYLLSYKGLGGEVVIPSDRGITTINPYAFSNYEYVEKDLAAGDVIDDEDPYQIKQMYIGEDTITKVVIPEGVTTIESYAFAKLTALEEVVLPESLTRIGVGAFLGCEKLKKINLEYVKFINEEAFKDCALTSLDLVDDPATKDVNEEGRIVAISNYAFENCKLGYVALPASAQSIGIGAFTNNVYMTSLKLQAKKVKLGSGAFMGCTELAKAEVNAAVLSSYAFAGCKKLNNVTLGKDVAVIGEYAFADTQVSEFKIKAANATLKTENDGALIINKKTGELVLAAPLYKGETVNGDINTVQTTATSIATGAFAGNTKIFNVIANNVVSVGAYAFTDCANLKTVKMSKLETVGDYAFAGTALTDISGMSAVKNIGNFAFALAQLKNLTVKNDVTIGEYAFAYNYYLENVTIGNNVTIGESAFYCPVELLTYENVGSFDYYTPYAYEVKDENGEVKETFTYYRYNYDAGVISSLESLTLGESVTIGDYAFFGHALLTTVNFGQNTTIGDYAFFNAANLTNVDLTKVKSIGDYAFSGSATYDYWKYNGSWSYAYELVMIDGNLSASGYITSYFAPAFEKIELTNAQDIPKTETSPKVLAIGEGAFAGNTALKDVTIGVGVTELPNFAFAGCEGMTKITLRSTLTEIGDQAFYGTSLKQVDLSYVDHIGDAAFAMTNLEKVTLKDKVVISDNAFAYCTSLKEIVNLNNAKSIGAYALMGVAVEELDISSAESVGDYAFAMSAVQSVKLGKNLATLGENPFMGCAIVDFGKDEEHKHNGAVVEVTRTLTYDVSETVKVIDGVLYQVVPNGLELISYPLLKQDAEYIVEEGTVRISARAFMGNAITTVTLPVSLNALGDKAFYGCGNLSVVTFKSYDAPILEEEYDTSYLTMENMPIPGYMGEFKGLGISKFYMWNIASSYNNFYFGANFVNYIGHIEKPLVMVKPANGQNYNSFIFSQYFGHVLQGNNAAMDSTLNVIGLIMAIPETITLNSEDAIVAARKAYDNIATTEQKALVENYNSVNYYAILSKAEGMLEYLKLNQETPPTEEPVTPPTEEESPFITFLANNAFGLIVAACAIAALAAYIVIDILRKKAQAGAKETADEVSAENNSEDKE
ncbi:MAG: leucine-rich repeat protein [Clostridia bacterium]|nr:leucine-rich repeat protein [Clostridia bacterium]